MDNIEIVGTALETHARNVGLDEDMSPTTIVFHFLVDLIAYCDAAGPRIDLDAELSNAREHLAEDKPTV